MFRSVSAAFRHAGGRPRTSILEGRAYPSEQLARTEGLDDVVVRTEFQRFGHRVAVGPSRDQDHRHVACDGGLT